MRPTCNQLLQRFDDVRHERAEFRFRLDTHGGNGCHLADGAVGVLARDGGVDHGVDLAAVAQLRRRLHKTLLGNKRKDITRPE